MLHPHILFGNFFNDPRISDTCLLNFAFDVLARLGKANGTGDYDTLIGQLMPVTHHFSFEAGQTDAPQLNHPQPSPVDEAFSRFRDGMIEMEPAIKYLSVGGEEAIYSAFYPNGLQEYQDATKTRLPILLKRVAKETDRYRFKLDKALADKLDSFHNNWLAAIREAAARQEASSGNTDNGSPRQKLETTLLHTIHAIAQKFPGNLWMCMSFFNFSLLFGTGEVQ